MNRQAAGTALVALAASAWGTWALFLRGHGLPPAWASAMILAVIALVSLPVALARRGPPRPPSAWALLGLAAVTDAANYLCYFGALDRGPIGVAVLTHYLAPVVVAGLAPAVLREPLTMRTRVALGVSPRFWSRSPPAPPRRRFPPFSGRLSPGRCSSAPAERHFSIWACAGFPPSAPRC